VQEVTFFVGSSGSRDEILNDYTLQD